MRQPEGLVQFQVVPHADAPGETIYALDKDGILWYWNTGGAMQHRGWQKVGE